MRKLRSAAGESISETLVSVLIISIVFLMLTTAVMTAAKINHAMKNEKAAFAVGDKVSTDGWGVTLQMGDDSQHVSASLYQTENGYRYYEYTP